MKLSQLFETVNKLSGNTVDGHWRLELNPDKQTPNKPDTEPDHMIRLYNKEGKVLAYICGNYYDYTFQVEYSRVVDGYTGKGVYTRLLDSIRKRMRVYSDQDHNNSAKGSYERLGARHDWRDRRYILDRQD